MRSKSRPGEKMQSTKNTNSRKMNSKTHGEESTAVARAMRSDSAANSAMAGAAKRKVRMLISRMTKVSARRSAIIEPNTELKGLFVALEM